jgi:predicted metalloprotease with PDZ domain
LQVGRDAFERPKAYRDFLRLVSHEVFHAWNVKALRPAGISPYRYDRENYTKLLWVSEGSTSYYADIMLVRAGLMTPDVYLKKLGERIDEFRRRPGRHVQSLEASSFDAWIKFNKATADAQNSTVSFYAKGALVSWMLDFELRLRTKNRVSYDTVLATMYRDFPLAGGGFTPEDLLATIERLAGSDFDAFRRDYISGTRDLDLESCASIAGLALVLKADREDEDDDGDSEKASNDEDLPIEEQPDLGIKLRDAHGRWVVDFVRSDGPAYQAGVIAGDELIALDGLRIREVELQKRLKAYESGDEVALTLFRRDELRTVKVPLAGRPKAKWVVKRIDEPSPLQQAVYTSWLGQDWPAPKDEDTPEDGT